MCWKGANEVVGLQDEFHPWQTAKGSVQSHSSYEIHMDNLSLASTSSQDQDLNLIN